MRCLSVDVQDVAAYPHDTLSVDSSILNVNSRDSEYPLWVLIICNLKFSCEVFWDGQCKLCITCAYAYTYASACAYSYACILYTIPRKKINCYLVIKIKV